MLHRGVVDDISVGIIDGSMTANQKFGRLAVYPFLFEEFMKSGVRLENVRYAFRWVKTGDLDNVFI